MTAIGFSYLFRIDGDSEHEKLLLPVDLAPHIPEEDPQFSKEKIFFLPEFLLLFLREFAFVLE